MLLNRQWDTGIIVRIHCHELTVSRALDHLVLNFKGNLD